MKCHKILVSLFGLLLTLGCAAAAQSCPNWSPKFDQITNKEVLAALRSTDWDAGIEQAGGPEAAIALFKATLKDARQHKEIAAQAAEDTASSTHVIFDATWDQCKSNLGANMAAKCEYLNMSELIMAMEGSIEIAQCRER
jgi:hypothetical protein